VFRKDGKTPVKGAEIWVARPDAPPPPDLPEKMEKAAVNYMDKSTKNRTDSQGRFVGNLHTVKGWKYHEFNGIHVSGPTRPPEPPMLDKIYVYVAEKGAKPIGYELTIPKAFQAEAISGVRKLHLPDLWIWDKPSTQPTTEEAEKRGEFGPPAH
jgi:hypothetical protein